MRVSYWDNWKGIAIIAVVFIHATGGAGAFDKGSFNWIFGISIRQLVDFAVPIFLAISGYFSAKNLEGSLINYYKLRLLRILTPYLIWTAIYILIRTPTDFPDYKEILQGFFFGTGIGVGYFVIVLFQFVILTPLYLKIDKKSTHLLIIVVTSIAGSIFIYYVSIFNQNHALSKFPLYALPFIAWYPFYHLGFFMARYKEDLLIDSRFKILSIAGFAIALLLSFCEGFYWAYDQNYNFGSSQLKITSMTASMFLFFIAISIKDRKSFLSRKTKLTWIGQNSYAIYLTHMLFLTASQKILNRLDAADSYYAALVLTYTSITLILCAATIACIHKLSTPSYSRTILGN